MRIMLSVPGPAVSAGTLKGVCTATDGRHDVDVLPGSCSWDGFNAPWAAAINAQERGEIDLFAMLHADIAPEPGWLDMLVDELLRTESELISAVVPIKDGRGVCSCGIGDPENPWKPLRRLTIREALALPETFDGPDMGFFGFALLHNHGCMVADVRSAVFHATGGDGRMKIYFDFPRRVRRDANGSFAVECESEDWFFSRMLHEQGVKSMLTRKVVLGHVGEYAFPNHLAWGQEMDRESGAVAPIPAKERACQSP